MYSYSPKASSEVSNRNLEPASIRFESNVSPKSSELVTVWATLSLFVHSIRFPCRTFTTSGS